MITVHAVDASKMRRVQYLLSLVAHIFLTILGEYTKQVVIETDFDQSTVARLNR